MLTKMICAHFLTLTFLLYYAGAQSGVDLDKPMLGGGGKRGPGAMLRFGCSQVRKVPSFVGETNLLGCD